MGWKKRVMYARNATSTPSVTWVPFTMSQPPYAMTDTVAAALHSSTTGRSMDESVGLDVRDAVFVVDLVEPLLTFGFMCERLHDAHACIRFSELAGHRA